MKKSKQVLLTTILLAAITSIKATAQEIHDRGENNAHGDSTASSSGHGGGGRANYVNPDQYRRSNIAPAAAHSTHPRTGGFGNTLRTFFSGTS